MSENVEMPVREVTSRSEQDLSEYRQWLVAAEQKGQGDFDKTVLTLSGGALGVSFAFVKDIVGPDHIAKAMLLFGAWTSWALSCFAVLASFYVSSLALREAIKQCDDKARRCEPPGGYFTTMTKFLNASGGVLFLCGVTLMALFVYFNLTNKDMRHGYETTITPTVKTDAATKPKALQPAYR